MKLSRLAARSLPWILLALGSALVLSRLQSPLALLTLMRPWAEIGALAFGMTAVILTGGIDLSIGSMVGLSGVVFGLLWEKAGWPVAWSCFGAITTGFLAGSLNATLIVYGITPLVTTLASMALYSGLAMALTRGERITGFPDEFTRLGQSDWLGMPSQLFLITFTFAVIGIIIHKTRPGRWLFALGENREAAAFAAVPVRRLEWWLYSLQGLLAGIVSLSFTARRGAAVADAGVGLELQVIGCVVLGGTHVSGGSGGVWQTLLGLLILANLDTGLRLLGNVSFPWVHPGGSFRLDANARLIAIGLLLVLIAVINERSSKTRRELR